MWRRFLIPVIIVKIAACGNAAVHKGTGSQLDLVLVPSLSQVAPDTHPAGITGSVPAETLMKLPLVEGSFRYIDSFNAHKHGIAFFPDTMGPGEIVLCGAITETYYNFTVNPQPPDSGVPEPVSGDYLSIDDFLKSEA